MRIYFDRTKKKQYYIMANHATISQSINNTIYVNSHPIEATVKDIDVFYNELESEISGLIGNFVLIVDMKQAKWLDREPRMQMAKRSKLLIEKYSQTYLGKILVFESSFTRSLVNLFNIAAKNSSVQFTTKTITEAEELATGLLYNHKKTLLN